MILILLIHYVKLNGIGRGESHYENAGHPLMKNYYFYHTWDSIQSIRFKVLFDPSSVIEKIRKLVVSDSPFPWIK